MIAIIGLGNTGEKYANTRHNIGFEVIQALAKTKELSSTDSDLGFSFDKALNADIAQTHFKETDILLAMPRTFVNASGTTVKKLKDKFRLKDSQIWVITDDLDLLTGMARIRLTGSSGGHNGLKDIIAQLDSQDFGRIRIGIQSGKDLENQPLDAKKFVLEQFGKRDRAMVDQAINNAVQYIVESLAKEELTATSLS